jgi:hypothetical protein
LIEEQARAFVMQPVKVTFLVAPKRHRQKRRRKGSKRAPRHEANEMAPII